MQKAFTLQWIGCASHLASGSGLIATERHTGHLRVASPQPWAFHNLEVYKRHTTSFKQWRVCLLVKRNVEVYSSPFPWRWGRTSACSSVGNCPLPDGGVVRDGDQSVFIHPRQAADVVQSVRIWRANNGIRKLFDTQKRSCTKTVLLGHLLLMVTGSWVPPSQTNSACGASSYRFVLSHAPNGISEWCRLTWRIDQIAPRLLDHTTFVMRIYILYIESNNERTQFGCRWLHNQ